MNTFNQLWGVTTPAEAEAKIQQERAEFKDLNPSNLEEQALFLGGRVLYETLIKGYTEKQWGRPATEIPSFIIKRLPFRFTFDNNYFNDRYQGIPIGGYNTLTDALLEGIEIKTGVNYFENKRFWDESGTKILYTGKIDEFFERQFGTLEYRSLHFETEVLDQENYQGNAVINYTEREIPYTRILEHKHFEFNQQPFSVLTREFPNPWTPDRPPYYPVNDARNNRIYREYRALAAQEPRVVFGGRLGSYRYYDMHHVIGAALSLAKNLVSGSR